MQKPIIECVPNFSEGRDLSVIEQICDEIRSVEGVSLLDVDPGKATNRTVVTFVGDPESVVEAAFRAIRKASRLIDMSKHHGEHARMGATDVCPLIPVSGISMEDTAVYAQKLAKRVGDELQIPVYLYGAAQSRSYRSDLSVIRAGEYEGFFDKIRKPEWTPDFGPAVMNAQTGASVIGARDFLIAYNVNLNTTSTRIANRIAFDVREAGRVKRIGNPYTGKVELDESGEPVRIPGACKAVKAVGWYIEEYGIAQISANLTNFKVTPLHVFFEEVTKSAESRGVRITGSELVGLIPLQAMLDAGTYFLQKQDRSAGVSEAELIHIAIKSLGLDELGPFDPQKKIVEYAMRKADEHALISLSAADLANKVASESPAPGGGSVSAYVGALGVSLATMVANLSANKRGWEDKVAHYGDWAVKGQNIKRNLLYLVDEDTRAFEGVMNAYQLPKNDEEEAKHRTEAIEKANVYATQIPLRVMKEAASSYDLLAEMVYTGNPNSITDAGVGVLCTRTAVHGAYMNVLINISGLHDKELAEAFRKEASEIFQESEMRSKAILEHIESGL
ncbi:MAG: glutamate formimidoyltransferase [Flavobacteriales bacterium]|nr:glutamate formimidoyltransferase [Flavobacteriales bacterium]